jgi:RNA polymerase sigma-70 factor (ECF subfamily)
MPEFLMNAIQEVKDGNASSFNEIIRAHQQGIYRLCYRLAGNVEDAKDLTQEVFIKALKGIGSFRGESDIRTWLYRIAINTGSTWRKKNLNQPLSFEVTGELADSKTRDVLLQRKISEAVDSLPYKQRSVFVMHHYEGYKHDEIARLTDRSPGSVKANYFQAVQKLKGKLKDFAEYANE